MSSINIYKIPQIRPTNVLIITITVQTAIVYLPNILDNTTPELTKKPNGTLNVEKPLK